MAGRKLSSFVLGKFTEEKIHFSILDLLDAHSNDGFGHVLLGWLRRVVVEDSEVVGEFEDHVEILNALAVDAGDIGVTAQVADVDAFEAVHLDTIDFYFADDLHLPEVCDYWVESEDEQREENELPI